MGRNCKNLDTLEFDSSYFLDSVLLNDSYKSTQIEGTQISQDEMYYLKYMERTDDNLEIQNLKRTIMYAYDRVRSGDRFNISFVNAMHRIVLESVRGSERSPGKIRITQNWIGPRGCKFETIHAYKDGNGRLGRALIPVQMAMLDQERPILYMSEILELYKPSYQRSLMESRRGNLAGFIKFFLQCTIDQCSSYIYKIGRIKEIYREDMGKIQTIRGNSVYRIMPVLMRQIVFTKKEVAEESGVSLNSVAKVFDQLVELGIIIPDATVIKKGFRYQRIYEVFVGSRAL